MSEMRCHAIESFGFFQWIGILFLILSVVAAGAACPNNDDPEDSPASGDDDQTSDSDETIDDDDDEDNPADDDDDVDDDDDDDDDDNDDDETPGDIWNDPITGLSWQNGDDGKMNWKQAVSYCEDLTWGGHDDWTLPTLSQLRSFIQGCADTATGGGCGVTDDCLAYMTCWNPPCEGCNFLEGPGPGGRYWTAGLAGDGWIYWSSNQVDENHFTAWRVHFYNGLVSYNDKEYLYWARCVRQAEK